MHSKPQHSFAFLVSGPSALVTVILVLQAIVFYFLPTSEFVPNPPPLKTFAPDVGRWKLQREVELDAETQAFLKADDTLNRFYMTPDGMLTLFVAFFRSQRGGVTPHSPKVCLPGAGWTPEGARIDSLTIPGEPKPIPVNRYLVRRGEARTVVIYWYATAHYTMADEYQSKLYLMLEGLLHRRSDEALYRVIAPIGEDGEAAAENRALEFIRSFYPPLKRQMWAN